jgi:hypothetical protein
MKKRIMPRRPLFCDMGPNKGYTRVDITAQLYLTADELAEYYASGEKLDIIIVPRKEDDK